MKEATEFTLSLETLPWLCSSPRTTPPGRSRSVNLAHPSVRIFPFLSEQGRHGETSQRPEYQIHKIPSSFEKIFKGVDVCPVEPLEGHELEYQGSSLAEFLDVAWPHLLSCNVLVTHRNFLANEVLALASERAAGNIPNAAVVRLRIIRQGEEDAKTILFVRHCTSHHNAARKGSGTMTTCADVSAIRQVAEEVRKQCGGREVLYGSSILPRAVLSCIALQREVSEGDLERVRMEFQPETKALPEEVISYQKSHACMRGSSKGSYCDGTLGTFILGSNRSVSYSK